MQNNKSLVYICQYGAKREKAWSGTYLKVYNELLSFFRVEEVDCHVSLVTRMRMKLAKKISVFGYDFMINDFKRSYKRINKKYDNENYCSFQYCETPIKENVHSYIYQDMCIEYLDANILSREALRKLYPIKRFSKSVVAIRRKEQNEFYADCAGIFTMGQWLADYLVNSMGIPSEKVHCVGAGVDINFNLIRPKEKQGNKILFIGRDFERKGGRILLDAFKILRSQFKSDAILYIIGPEENPLEEAIEGVEYLGPKSSEELMEYYNISDVFCMPSYIEPYGKVYAEALCCGVPCIARNLFSGPEIISDGVNGYLLEEDSAENLAELLRKALENVEMREYVSSHMMDYRHQYSWHTVVEKMARVISKDPYMN